MLLPSSTVYRLYRLHCVYICMKGKCMRCDVCMKVSAHVDAVVVAPDDATKCQNWLKIHRGVVSGRATPRYCRCVDQTLCTDVTMLEMSHVCVLSRQRDLSRFGIL